MKARIVSRLMLVVGASAIVTAMAGAVLASPLLIYTRWVGDTDTDFLRDPDGAFFSLCDFGLTVPSTKYQCVPNQNFQGGFSGMTHSTSEIPDVIGGIGIVDRRADGVFGFLALGRLSGSDHTAVGGQIRLADSHFVAEVDVQPTVGGPSSVSLPFGANTVGFAVAPGADRKTTLFQARSTGANLFVDIVPRTGLPTPAPAPISLIVPGMLTVSRAANADFQGFTADDLDGDGKAELMVLHKAPVSLGGAVVSVFKLDGTFMFDVPFSVDPLATHRAVSTLGETYVGGFAHTKIADTGSKEFVVLTVDHRLPGGPPRQTPTMDYTLWRFEDHGNLTVRQNHLESVPVYTGAIVVGIAGDNVSDNNCNGIDEDRDGTADEDYVPDEAKCGKGECAASTRSSCSNGVVTPPAACVPGRSSLEQVDGKDNDCDEMVDEIPELPACAPNDANWWCCPQGGTLRFTVNTTVDALSDVQAADGCFPVGSGNTGTCSLRGVVRRAAQLRGRPGVRPLCSVVAELPIGDHQLQLHEGDALFSHLVFDRGDLTIQGMGAIPADVNITARRDAPSLDLNRRIIDVSPFDSGFASLTIRNVTMRHGRAEGMSGGAIYSQAPPVTSAAAPRLAAITVEEVTFSQNSSNQPGGAVFVANGRLTVRDSLFRNNSVDNYRQTGGQTSRGGALAVEDALVAVERTAFAGNSASKGGAIDARNRNPLRTGNISIFNSTIARNLCAEFGCGLTLDNISTILRFNTITANQMASNTPGNVIRRGPGLNGDWAPDFAGQVDITGNIIAGNLQDGVNVPRPGIDGVSSDCHVVINPAATSFVASTNLIGAGGVDCAALGDPSDMLIGQGVPRNTSNPADPEINPMLNALNEVPTGACGPSDGADFKCQLVCPSAIGPQECILSTIPGGPAVDKSPAPRCPADDQRQFERRAGLDCTLGAFEHNGIAPQADQAALAALPRGDMMATASGTGPGDSAASAMDGNINTRFSTGTPQTQGQWFSVDLRTRRLISQITMDPGPSTVDFIRQYQVFVSDDAVTWSGPVASGTGSSGVLSVPFPTQAARFVGVVQTGSGPNWWSIAEFNVYGPGSVPVTPLAPTGWTATASATNGSEVPSRAFDANPATRWSTGVPQAPGQSFQLDMLQPRTIAKLALSSDGASDFPRGYQIFATNNTANWGSPIASGTGTSTLVTASFPTTTARYLKIVQTGSSSNWWSIAELTVYGLGSFSPVATALPRLGWTATSSPLCSAEPASRALDDQPNTRFSTCQDQVNGQYIQVDMQSERVLSRITLDAGNSVGDYPRGYAVYASNNTSSWGSPVATGAGTGQLVTISFPSRSARHLKIVQSGSASKWWSIHELNVYGLAPAVLPRNGWSASASLSSSTAGAGIDSNLSTRWTAGVPQANGQWYQLDLGGARTFNQIRLDSDGASSDYPRGYQVFASNNPSSLGTAIATGTASAPLVSIGFPVQTARYVRIVQTGSSTNWWSISELNLWAPAQ